MRHAAGRPGASRPSQFRVTAGLAASVCGAMPASPVQTLHWSTSKGSYRARFWLTPKALNVKKGPVYVDGVARTFVGDVVVQKYKKARERENANSEMETERCARGSSGKLTHVGRWRAREVGGDWDDVALSPVPSRRGRKRRHDGGPGAAYRHDCQCRCGFMGGALATGWGRVGDFAWAREMKAVAPPGNARGHPSLGSLPPSGVASGQLCQPRLDVGRGRVRSLRGHVPGVRGGPR